MPAGLRPNKKLAKLLYDLMHVPKEEQQGSKREPSKLSQEAWDIELKETRRYP